MEEMQDSIVGLSTFYDIPVLGDEGSVDIPLYITASYAVWGNPDAPDYLDKYAVRITFMGHSILFHKWAVVPLKAVEAQLKSERIKYDFKVVQSYNNRNIRGSNRKSMHAWPLAIDINPATNPYTHGALVTDMPKRMVEIFRAHGFSWGGSWNSIKDAMHYEYIGKPVKEVPKPKPKPHNFLDNPRTLRLAKPYMSGEDVKWVQTMLQRLGHTKAKVDGIYGPVTEGEVKVLQRNSGLVSDGICGTNTWNYLKSKAGYKR